MAISVEMRRTLKCMPGIFKEIIQLMKCHYHISELIMDNFYVLGSNLSFPTSPHGAMTGSGYHLCGRYSGTPPVGALSRVTCQPQPITARFVYIQVDRSLSPAHLELCEVWVFASKCITKVTIQYSTRFLTIFFKSRWREIGFIALPFCSPFNGSAAELSANFRAIGKPWPPISLIQDFMRSYDKTPYVVLNCPLRLLLWQNDFARILNDK